MMRKVICAAFVGAVGLVVFGGCSGTQTRIVKINDHTFDIPKEHLVQGRIPWLPISQSDGLKIIVNPEARLEEQLIVTIEAAQPICRDQPLAASSQLTAACAAAAQGDGWEHTQATFFIEKRHRYGDPTQWEYRLKGQGTVVASCYALSSTGESGLCTSLYYYKNLIYSVSLRDSDVNNLPSILRKIGGLLASWEKI